MEIEQRPPSLKFSIDRILQGADFERDDSNSSCSEQSESPSPTPYSPAAVPPSANAQFYPYLLQLMSTMQAYPFPSPTCYATAASRNPLCGGFSPQFFRQPDAISDMHSAQEGDHELCTHDCVKCMRALTISKVSILF